MAVSLPSTPIFFSIGGTWLSEKTLPKEEKAMGYIMNIHYVDLELPVEKKLSGEPTFLGWGRVGEHIEPTDRYFNPSCDL